MARPAEAFSQRDCTNFVTPAASDANPSVKKMTCRSPEGALIYREHQIEGSGQGSNHLCATHACAHVVDCADGRVQILSIEGQTLRKEKGVVATKADDVEVNGGRKGP